ncbi:NAD(P)/FAD-dependent oxidoreductase [Parendozoicomonas haliclonae]|uniref:Gamma-glutamylputrescine oxidoreductase n=1 Tax=Parendozoicomonas haliclonae TaxID=1960125 RepID=A0A1X7AR74_9GAMM|nr:FAD-binding oxidoreductase [Parendozoicomonas haliclonae]SMA50806.1 Gamma-glutamylputrescine oxidoreductase [Parendozoicomonas haliclonae]
MHADSIYAATAHTFPQPPHLVGEHKTDVVVIGAGLTGISAALELTLKGYSVSVLEAHDIGWGASGRSGGQLIVGIADSVETMIRTMGKADAKKAFDISVEAIQLVKDRVARHNIDCDLTSGQLEVASKASHVRDFQQSVDIHTTEFNYPLQFKTAEEITDMTGSPIYHGGCYDPAGGHVHPLNYTLGLARAAAELGVRFYEHSPVVDIKQQKQPLVIADKGQIRCDYLVVASNAYIDRLVPDLARYILPVGSYICATEPVPDNVLKDNPAVADSKYLLSYFRKDVDGRLLWGGRTGLTRNMPENVRQVMTKRIEQAFPQLKGIRIEKHWGGNIAVTMNRMPHFGRLQNNIYFLHGYSGHGMAMSGMGGKLLAEAVSGDAERFDLFTRIRHNRYPGGTLLRAPALAAAMIWFGIRDALG